MGVVYHANFLPYFETGRTELLRSLGRSYRDVEDAGLLLVVADAGLKFHRPAAYDDLLRVTTRLVALTGVRLRFEYAVDREADGVLVATGHTTLASTDRVGRPVRIPAEFHRLLTEVVEPVAAPSEGPRASPEGPRGPAFGKIARGPGVQGRTS